MSLARLGGAAPAFAILRLETQPPAPIRAFAGMRPPFAD
jgi:hypothetical protein